VKAQKGEQELVSTSLNDRGVNRYLEAFLFGKKPVKHEVYLHFAYRFRHFKNKKTRHFFNWYAFILGPFYFAYRRLLSLVFEQIILYTLGLSLVVFSLQLHYTLPVFVVLGLTLLGHYVQAYRIDYLCYKLYNLKVDEFKKKRLVLYDAMKKWGGSRPSYVVLAIFLLLVASFGVFMLNNAMATYLPHIRQILTGHIK
jgi:hypothetical protein